jgi:hypothetical protein
MRCKEHRLGSALFGSAREVRRHGRLGKVIGNCQLDGVNWMSCTERSLLSNCPFKLALLLISSVAEQRSRDL